MSYLFFNVLVLIRPRKAVADSGQKPKSGKTRGTDKKNISSVIFLWN